MSRLVVKNLPKTVTEKFLRELFSQKGGTITDIQLKYTKDGIFRNFAFIGYKDENEATIALKYFNNICINTNKIVVEQCTEFGSADSKRIIWSKHSVNSIVKKKLNQSKSKDEIKNKNKSNVKENRKSRIEKLLADHKDDPKFIEYIAAHAKDKKGIWSNDIDLNLILTTPSENKQDATITEVEDDDSFHNAIKIEEEDELEPNVKLANLEISDNDYLQSLKKGNVTKTIKKSKNEIVDLYTVKIREIPFKTKRQDLIKFFKPLKPYSIRLPQNVHGFCYVGFKSDKDFQKALLKHRSFLKGKQVFLSDFTAKNNSSKNSNDNLTKANEAKWVKQNESLKNEEAISESGKIFFRNLAYTIDETELQKCFEKYGPIADINLPIDSISRQIKGFGTVTFVMPEHAVNAYTELDGKVIHGRLLHLLPCKNDANDDDKDNDNYDGLSYKEKKAKKLKEIAKSSHNWNSLFLGSNAVANVLAKNYETTKKHILDTESGGSSAAVRLALGETEIILQMKKFLSDNGVCLDVFDKTKSHKLSKTVILAKNLPANTKVSDLQPLFAKHGLIGRIVLPPSGVTALIEYFDSYEAKNAFKKLAYSKFKDLPLYLEWAPENTFITSIDEHKLTENSLNIKKNDDKLNAITDDDDYNNDGGGTETKTTHINVHNTTKDIAVTSDNNINKDKDDELEPETDTTLFLRNLNFITQVPTIQEHFKHLGSIHMAQVAMKKDPNNPSKRISLGYGFIQFKHKKVAETALKTMQFTTIDGNAVELKRSDRTLKSTVNTNRKIIKNIEQTGTKILVRNIPFQAKINEVRDVFQAFGSLKSIRIPKKMSPGEDAHRGFGFIDFHNIHEAKQAFEALCQSTHLYGRRLVLEWAAVDEDIAEKRKRVADQFAGSSSSQKKSKKGVFNPPEPELT